MDKTPILVASQLLELVKETYGNPQPSPFEIYDKKYQIEDLCGKLLRSVLGPLEYTALLAESCQESSALGFVTRLGVPDLLGDETMSVPEISDALGIRAKYLKVALSCLTKHGYFDEATSTGFAVYRNNELSNILKETHPTSLKDAVGFICDEGFQATSHLVPASKIMSSRESQVKDIPAINLAFGFNQTVFEWMSQEAWRGKRMGNAMQQLHRMANANVIFDYDWSALNSPIVDVGGGIGSLELALVKNRPGDRFQFVNFDLPEVIENSQKVWKSQSLPDHSSITFQAGDLMAPAFEETFLPAGKPTYVIRHVLHDWSDAGVLHILKHIFTAMSTRPVDNSVARPKLILCEMLLRPDSHRFIRTTSMQLLSLNGGQARTEAEITQLLEKAGFSVVKTYNMRAADSVIEAIIP